MNVTKKNHTENVFVTNILNRVYILQNIVDRKKIFLKREKGIFDIVHT